MNNKKITKSEKNIKIKSYKSEINNNSNNKLLISKNEEEKMGKKKIRKYKSKIDNKNLKNNIFLQSKIINEKRNINNFKNNNNISCTSLNKFTNYTHIEFPAIDSYFH